MLQRLFTEYPGKHFIGQVITLEEGIVDGKGNIRLDNQAWQLAGSDCPPPVSYTHLWKTRAFNNTARLICVWIQVIAAKPRLPHLQKPH